MRKAADLRRRLPRGNDSTDAVVDDEDGAAAALSAGLGDAAESTRETIGLGSVGIEESCCFILKLGIYDIYWHFLLLYVFWADDQNEKRVVENWLPSP